MRYCFRVDTTTRLELQFNTTSYFNHDINYLFLGERRNFYIDCVHANAPDSTQILV